MPEDLIRWLNDGPTASTRNITTWIDEAHRLTAVARELWEGCDEKEMASLEQIADHIDAIISKYRAVPRLLSPELWEDPEEGPRFIWEWELEMSPADLNEWNAVLAVMRLSDRGVLLRVRRCAAADCRRWYYAKFPHMRFHLASCKQRHKTSSEAFKAHRREYMKGYYRQHLSALPGKLTLKTPQNERGRNVRGHKRREHAKR